MNTRDKSSVLTRGKRMIIYCFRALVLSSMFWSVAPFLSTAQTCNVWEIEFSPAGSGSLSSCRQVSLAEREDVLPGIMNSQYFTPDIIMNVLLSCRMWVLDKKDPGVGSWPAAVSAADQEPPLDAGWGKLDSMSRGLTSTKSDFHLSILSIKFWLSLQIVDLQLQHIWGNYLWMVIRQYRWKFRKSSVNSRYRPVAQTTGPSLQGSPATSTNRSWGSCSPWGLIRPGLKR